MNQTPSSQDPAEAPPGCSLRPASDDRWNRLEAALSAIAREIAVQSSELGNARRKLAERADSILRDKDGIAADAADKDEKR